MIFLLLCALGALLVPVLLVASLRVHNPSVTVPMLQQSWTNWRSGGGTAPQKIHWLQPEEIPLDFVRFVWTSEDQRFFRHSGFDWVETRKALEQARRTGAPPRGASTITMQTARSTFLWHGRSWPRKALETYFTVLMEWLLGKQRILEIYVNVIETGPGSYGLHAGSKLHYGRTPSDLRREELAMLAAILPNPKEWSPVTPSPNLLRRRDRILRRAETAPFPESQWRQSP